MAKGFKHGGSGMPLNFKVVGNPQPTNPKENTIWVNTDTKITSYVFSATQPSSPAAGMVWICVDEKSSVKFNALKRNGLEVYPLRAKQYVSSKWVDVTAKSYQGGKWVDWWNGELYKKGDEYTPVTGGWKAEAKQGESSTSSTAKAPTVTRGTDDIKFAMTTSNSAGIARTTNAIDLSKFSKLTVTGTIYNGDSYEVMMALVVWSKIGTYYLDNIVARKNVPVKTSTSKLEIDVSSINSSCYIGFYFNTANGSKNSYVTMTSCLLS